MYIILIHNNHTVTSIITIMAFNREHDMSVIMETDSLDNIQGVHALGPENFVY